MTTKIRENEIRLLVNYLKNNDFTETKFVDLGVENNSQSHLEYVQKELINIKKNNNLRIGDAEFELLFKYIIEQAYELKISLPDFLTKVKRKSLNNEIIETINYYLSNFKKKKLVPTKNITQLLNRYNIKINDLFLLSKKDIQRINFNLQDWEFLNDFMKKYKLFFSDKVELVNLIKSENSYHDLSKRSKDLLIHFFTYKLNVDDFLFFDQNFSAYKRQVPNLPSNIGKFTYLEILAFFKNNFINNNDDLLSLSKTNNLFLREASILTSQNSNIELKFQELEELSSEDLCILLSEIRSLHFSFRTENSLINFGLKRVGQIFFHGIERIKYIPNMGTKSVNEIVTTLSETCSISLRNININNWPDEDTILTIIKNKKLKINNFHVLHHPSAKYIEQELVHFIENTSSNKIHLIFKNRYGLNEKQISYTLQELGDSKMYDNKVVSRERIRQLIAKAIKFSTKFNIDYKLLSKLDQYLINNEISSEKEVDKYCHVNNLSKFPFPSQFIEISKEWQFPYFTNISKINIPSTGEIFFVFDEYNEILKNFFKEISDNLYGFMFFYLNNHSLIKKNILSIEQAKKMVEHTQNYILIEDNSNYFIFKNMKNLDVRVNKLANLFGKIFRIVKKIDIQYLYEGIMSYRLMNTTEKQLMSKNILEKYLSKLNIFEIEDNYIFLKYRPSSKHIAKDDEGVLSVFFQYGRIVDTKQYINAMLKLNYSRNQASVIGYTNPFLVTLSKGLYSRRGMKSFIFAKEDLYFNKLEDLVKDDDLVADLKSLSFTIDSKVKLQGILKINELNVNDGNYEILDDHENVISKIKVTNNILYGLNKFAIKEKEGTFNLSFNKNINCFYISRLLAT